MFKLIFIFIIVTDGVWFQITVEANQCKKHEYFDLCPNNNPQTCSTIDQKYPCATKCQPACRCKPWYVRNNNGDCVPQSYCSKCTNPHEVYVCPDCSPQTCETKDIQYTCSTPSPFDCYQPKTCNLTCRCQNGYYRNKINQCISAKDCDKCTGPFEYFGCGSECDNECGSKYGQDNCNIQNIQCVSKCYCEKNYSRATNRTCIPKRDCKFECPVNERYEKCPDSICKPKTCVQAGSSANCTSSTGNKCPGKPGCICIDGYLRNSSGKCVPSTSCPSCGGDVNATSGCGTNCGRLCSNYNSSQPVSCTAECDPYGCNCRSDYVFDVNTKKCVLPKDCTPTCGKNEVFSNCTNGGCGKKYCTDRNRPNVCVKPDKCNSGCICKKGYLINSKGVCVPTDQCDNCPENERYSECPANECTPKTCSEAGFPLNCTTQSDSKLCPGKPGCVCNDTYLRNDQGVCIPSEDCPSCGGDKNATAGCGVNCGNLCSNYNSSDPIFCILICYPNACDCRDGYVYDDNTDQCVLPTDCTPVCDDNEVYTTCANGGCDKQYCSERNFPNQCRCPDDCKDGCVCQNKYLRSSNGTCIPANYCDYYG